jgi:hypothetical protein
MLRAAVSLESTPSSSSSDMGSSRSRALPPLAGSLRRNRQYSNSVQMDASVAMMVMRCTEYSTVDTLSGCSSQTAVTSSAKVLAVHGAVSTRSHRSRASCQARKYSATPLHRCSTRLVSLK